MDIRDTVSRVLLGIAFGFVMGIVMYQAAGVDAGVKQKGVLRAQTQFSSTGWTDTYNISCNPSGGGTCVSMAGGGGFYSDSAQCAAALPSACPFSSTGTTNCHGTGENCDDGGGCCNASESCEADPGTMNYSCRIPMPSSTGFSSTPMCPPPQFQCVDTCCDAGQTCNSSTWACETPSSASSSACGAGFSDCGGGLCCNDSYGHCESGGCVPNSSASSNSNSSSSGGCCNTVTNSCE